MGDHIGSLEVGKQADLVIANPNRLGPAAVYDPMFTGLAGLTGRESRRVIVEGRWWSRSGVARVSTRPSCEGASRAMANDHEPIRIDHELGGIRG